MAPITGIQFGANTLFSNAYLSLTAGRNGKRDGDGDGDGNSDGDGDGDEDRGDADIA